MKKLIYLIIAIFISISLGEYYSSFYGNGLFVFKRNLIYKTSIIKINDPYIIYDDGRAYISAYEDYETKDGTCIKIKSFIGYGISNDTIYFAIESNIIKTLAFGSKEDVFNKTPVVFNTLKGIKYNVKEEPTIIYYWRLIALLLSALVVICISLLLYRVGKRVVVNKVKVK